MSKSVRNFWLNLAIGLLGLIIGLSYLINVFVVISNIKDLVLGVLLVLIATGWLVYLFTSKKVESKST